MATLSNIRVDWTKDTSVPPLPGILVDALPFPAAIVNPGCVILQVNKEWLALHAEFGAGADFLAWCETVHSGMQELCTCLVSGMQAILSGASEPFVQDYGADENRYRVSLAACGGGVLVLHQSLRPPAGGPEDEKQAQARKMETVGRLVGGVAHDFANLLTLIAGYSDILLNRIGEKDPLRPELDEIRKAANRGSRLTAQLLGFTRNQTVQPKPLDLNALIIEMQRMLRPIIGEYVDVETRLSPNLGKVIADAGQMEQMIMNLVLNARDAMPSGGHIRIETFSRELDEESAREHGVEQRADADAGHQRYGPGHRPSGHGAPLRAVFHHQGKRQGNGPRPEHGAQHCQAERRRYLGQQHAGERRYLHRVPAVRRAEWENGQEASSAPRQVAAGSETVLLVEDEDPVRRLLVQVLHRRGYKVLEAANGEEALRLFEKHGAEIHLVLTDMVMPKMTGRELAEHVRRLRPDTKVMFMSGYTDDVLVRTGALAQGCHFCRSLCGRRCWWRRCAKYWMPAVPRSRQ